MLRNNRIGGVQRRGTQKALHAFDEIQSEQFLSKTNENRHYSAQFFNRQPHRKTTKVISKEKKFSFAIF